MSERTRPFVFVIPLRNPGDDKVVDYTVIEAMLNTTLCSLSSQTGAEVKVVVVCHRVPAWSDRYSGLVEFLTVGESSAFSPNRNIARLDKGLRYIVGLLYAEQTYGPELAMLMDADDYVHRDLAAHVRGRFRRAGETDGFVVVKGVEVKVRVRPDYGVEFRRALRVAKFDTLCGSCRIFAFDRLVDRLHGTLPVLSSWKNRSIFTPATRPDEVRVAPEFTEALRETTLAEHQGFQGIVNVIGRHTHQDVIFGLNPLELVGAAKSCGHGNHGGSFGGSVHWKRVRWWLPTQEFLHSFGLSSLAAGEV